MSREAGRCWTELAYSSPGFGGLGGGNFAPANSAGCSDPGICFGGGRGGAPACPESGLVWYCCCCCFDMTGGSFAKTCCKNPMNSAMLALSHIPLQSFKYG